MRDAPCMLYPLLKRSGQYFMELGSRRIRFTSGLAVEVLQQCQGALTRSEIIAEFPEDTRTQVSNILLELERNGLIASVPAYVRFHSTSNNPQRSFELNPMSDAVAAEAIRRAYVSLDPATAVSGTLVPEPSDLGRLICARRSARQFAETAVSRSQLEQILLDSAGSVRYDVAPSGLTTPHRVIPQAGAITSVTAYLLVLRRPADLTESLYRLCPHTNTLHRLQDQQPAKKILHSLGAEAEPSITACAAVIAFTANLERKAFKYANRGYRYALIECGCALQNAVLSLASQGLAGYPYGGFYDRELADLLQLDYPQEIPVISLVIGMPQE